MYDSPSRPVEDSTASPEMNLSRAVISHGRTLSRKLGIEAQGKRVLEWFQTHGMFDQPSVPAESVVDAILDHISAVESDTNLFLWGHLMDTHSPYSPPDQYRGVISETLSEKDVHALNQKIHRRPDEVTNSEAELLKDLYIGCARYVDDQIARVVTEVKSRDLWEETLLVITSDHGEMFSERSIPDYYPFEHPSYLCDYITHVPLVFAGGTLSEDTIGGTVSGMDIAPTIATVVGAEIPDMWRGIPIGDSEHDKREHVYSVTDPGSRLIQKDEGFPESVMHASLRTKNRAILWWSDATRESEFYERSQTHTDPTAHETPIDVDDSSGKAYVDLIASRFSEVEGRTKGVAEHADGLDEETADRLRELGYIE